MPEVDAIKNILYDKELIEKKIGVFVTFFFAKPPNYWAVVITAAGDSSTQRGGGIGKSLGWENVVSPSNQMTVIVSTTNKHVYISFYGVGINNGPRDQGPGTHKDPTLYGILYTSQYSIRHLCK